MPITKSARKALRQSKRKHEKNLKRKEAIKNIVKKIKKLTARGKTEEAKALIPQAYKAIDKATKSFLHRKTAARKKSRLIKVVRKATASQAG